MVRNPLPVFTIVAAYLYFVLSLGPRLMKDRQPFNLDRVMMVYNAVQVVWCAYLVRECLRLGWGGQYSWICEPMRETKTQDDYDTARGVYLYFILKIVDLLDTVFMVLRKNFRQISFLHVYHHAGMAICIYLGVKIYPGGHHTFLGFINCIVHCFLYGYYLLTLLEPRVKGAWWKKYITLIQLVQFGMNMVHELLPVLMPSCTVDRWISGPLIIQNVFMFLLFGEFYYKNYVRQQGPGPQRREKET
ncbi:Elongation of very long chain fatty acids protein [Frankliniella fusca]|uniref:Elongation of very long chain fatty acids protein n=1 Tax=Frankliniella fusca TaxID=407009 RepID=A0AAE1HZQ7_9NEOP|nr:Elongation of very long chain fatty acids protein [Frankliniella fusca]